MPRPKPGLCLLPPRASPNDWRRAEPDANHEGSPEGAANTDLAEVSAQEYHSFFTDCLHQNSGFSIPALSAREGISIPALSAREGISIPALPAREGISIPSLAGRAGMENRLSYLPSLGGQVWKIGYHTFPRWEGRYGK